MHGEVVSFPFLKRNNELPFYFDEDEVGSVPFLM